MIPERIGQTEVVDPTGQSWSVSSILWRGRIETIAFENRPRKDRRERQINVYADSHEAAVAQFERMISENPQLGLEDEDE